ncbi:MAG: DUF2220 domain-containing protein [Alcanivorax sp.]|nr:DUF2220 domain-containing protein [Alcanivorax sp.]
MTAPIWLQEEPWLQRWLEWFTHRLDTGRTQAITRRVKKSTIPELYQFGEDSAYRWQLLERLASEYGIFDIVYDKKIARHQERYENAQFRFRPDSEDLLREWLNRPRTDPVIEAWKLAIGQHADCFADQGVALLNTRPCAEGLTPAELVAGFAAIADHLHRTLTLREISARCFRGDSKFLDHRQDLLQKLFGERAANIQPRPLLLTAWAPAGFTQLLIVENQDSFLRLVDNPPARNALLYSGGFRASADRLTSKHTRFAFLPGSDANGFEQRWRSGALPVFFWGDLDFSGMGILRALRSTLPQLAAWQPGYAPMVAILEQGGGHAYQQAGKSGQIDPGATGCTYADTILLPILRATNLGVDQESIVIHTP